MREDLLSEFPAIERYAYLNAASIGLVPKRTIDAVRGVLGESDEGGCSLPG